MAISTRQLLLAILVIVNLKSSLAQSCEPYNLTSLYSAVCLTRAQYPIFVPAGTTQKEHYEPILSLIFRNSSNNIVASSSTKLPAGCEAPLIALLCGIAVPGLVGCFNRSVAAPSPLCLSSCQAVIDACGSGISSALKINCSATSPYTGLELFIPDNTTQAINSTLSLGCVRPNVVQSCEDWLTSDPKRSYGRCYPRCRYGIFPKKKVKGTAIATIVLCWVNLPMNFFVILSYLLDPAKRKYPVIFPLFVSINYFFSELSVVLVSLVGVNKVLCETASSPHTLHSSGMCAFSGIVTSYAAVGGALWILVMMSSLTWFLFKGTYLHRIVQVPFHIFAWGLPLALNVYGGVKDGITGGEPASTGCIQRDTSAVVVFYPYVLAYGLAALLVVISSMRIFAMTGKNGLVKQRQLLLFVGCLSLLSLQAIVSKIYLDNSLVIEKVAPPFLSYTNCLWNRKVGLISGATVCKRPEPVNYSVVAFTYISSLLGLMLPFFFFGITEQNRHFWKRLVQAKGISGLIEVIVETRSSVSSSNSPARSTSSTDSNHFSDFSGSMNVDSGEKI